MSSSGVAVPLLLLAVIAFAVSAPCEVKMSKMDGFSLHIKSLRSPSSCKVKINSGRMENITVRVTVTVIPKDVLTLQDCSPEDIQVTATKVISGGQPKDCLTKQTKHRLLLPALPALPPCLAAALSSVTWTLRPPQGCTVELTPLRGLLKQSLPEQQCNGSIIIKVVEDDGTTIGDFCRNGVIRKVQIHTNKAVTVSVNVSGVENKALRTTFKNVLDATFKEKISESYIFNVSPKNNTPVRLATPGWPRGMKSSTTVSWIFSVPQTMDARLVFDDISQPECSSLHTGISVQRVGDLEEKYSRREDEKAEKEITVSGNFYLNMTNCVTESGDFRVRFTVTLQMSLMLTIILSVVATLVIIFVIVLVAVCVVIRKKKKKLNHQVSIYNPNGTSFLPGHSGFPKTREDNESHVYASIEDSLVYTDLLRKGAEMGVYGEFDTYRTFPGHKDSKKPPVCGDTDTDDMPVRAHQQFEAPPLPVRPPSHVKTVDNGIYQTESEEDHSPNLEPRLEPDGGN